MAVLYCKFSNVLEEFGGDGNVLGRSSCAVSLGKSSWTVRSARTNFSVGLAKSSARELCTGRAHARVFSNRTENQLAGKIWAGTHNLTLRGSSTRTTTLFPYRCSLFACPPSLHQRPKIHPSRPPAESFARYVWYNLAPRWRLDRSRTAYAFHDGGGEQSEESPVMKVVASAHAREQVLPPRRRPRYGAFIKRNGRTQAIGK